MSKSKFDGVDIIDITKRIEQGMVFETSSKIVVANAGGVGKWLFKTGDKRVLILQRAIITNANELDYQVIANPTVIDVGTPTIMDNMNAADAQPQTAFAYSEPNTSGGTPIAPVYMPGAEGTGTRTVGQFNNEGNVRILSPNTYYAPQVTNNGTVLSANVEIYIMWAELNDPSPGS